MTELRLPSHARVETWINTGTEVSAYYDPLLAKIIVKAPDRDAALSLLRDALEQTQVSGFETNLGWLRQIAGSEMFARAKVTTQALAGVPYVSCAVRVLTGGLATTVQDYPGRLGLWHVGVPPSGPMDSLAFRLGNRLLENAENAAGLEITAVGPTLAFDLATAICLVGADCGAVLDDEPLQLYRPVAVAPGQDIAILQAARPRDPRVPAVQGGLASPRVPGLPRHLYSGTLWRPAGRNLAAGDVLHLQETSQTATAPGLPDNLHPRLTHEWRLRVLSGPHGAPDFFTAADIEAVLEVAGRFTTTPIEPECG